MLLARLGRNALLRIAPFALFMLLLAVRGIAPEDGRWGFDPRWLYAVSVLAVGSALAASWRDYGELARPVWPDLREAALAVAAGALVFVLWIGLDEPWMRLGEATAGFRPVDAQGQLIWPLVGVRWIDSPHFEAVPPQRVSWRAVVLSTFVFVLAHTLWLAAIIAGLVYALLYIRTGKLGVAVLAHVVTNAALGAWVVLTGIWGFW
jgi:uncharacterized protein